MIIRLHTNFGPITISLHSNTTPNTVENFLEYLNGGFFENTIFHRVIKNFMIQGGGFLADGASAIQPKPMPTSLSHMQTLTNEADVGGSNLRGTIAMARTMDPHSASTQFFINLKDNLFLNHQSKTAQGWGYCVFGQVTQGMDIVEKIGEVKTTQKSGHDDVPVETILLERVEVLEKMHTNEIADAIES